MKNILKLNAWMAAWLIAYGAAAPAAYAQTCDLSEYKPVPGLTASADASALAVNWEGERNEEVRLRLAISGGKPIIEELAVRRKGGGWAVLATNLAPEYNVVSGVRRMTDQQLKPLETLGVKITPEILNQDRWEAFWDAPLNIPGNQVAHGDSQPPLEGIAGQPGLPRKPEEVLRSGAEFQVRACAAKTNGERLEVSYPGVQLGLFSGALQYTVYKGSNLIRQEVVAKTDAPAVAYKYDAGFRGMAIGPTHVLSGGTPPMSGRTINLAELSIRAR